MFSAMLSILVGIIWIIRWVLMAVIVISPPIVAYILYRFMFRKQFYKLGELRNEKSYSKWKETEYSIFGDRSYSLTIKDYLKEFNPKLAILRTIIILFIFLLSFSTIYSEIFTGTTESSSWDRSLYAFEDNQGFYIRGGLFTTNGADELVYYYTLKNGNSSFKSYRAKSSISTIYYTDENPKVKYTKKHMYFLDDKWHTPITRLLIPKKQTDGTLTRIDFYIPKGSVQQNYNSDLK